MYSEYKEEVARVKIPSSLVTEWVDVFSDPNFYCLLGTHGRKMVGLVTCRVRRYLDVSELEVESFILRREWRGKFKPLRLMVTALRDLLDSKSINKVVIMLPEDKMPKVLKRSSFVRGEK